MPLKLPKPLDVEALANPKKVLHAAILTASAFSGRRLRKKKRDLPLMQFRLAELISDFSPLERVPAFAAFLRDLDHTLEQLARQSAD